MQETQEKRCGFDPWVGRIPWRRKWQPTPVFLLGKSHGQKSVASYSSQGLKESDTTEGLSAHTYTPPKPSLLNNMVHSSKNLISFPWQRWSDPPKPASPWAQILLSLFGLTSLRICSHSTHAHFLFLQVQLFSIIFCHTQYLFYAQICLEILVTLN